MGPRAHFFAPKYPRLWERQSAANGTNFRGSLAFVRVIAKPIADDFGYSTLRPATLAMSLARVRTRTMLGINPLEVTVEVHLSQGLPGFAIVGMPETAVRESKERVRSAILNSGLDFPLRRITVNLAPADLPKQGCSFDLAIALGILLSSGQLPEGCMEQLEAFGELSLDGQLRPVGFSLPFVRAASAVGRQALLPTPAQSSIFADFGLSYWRADSLMEAVSRLLKVDETTTCAVNESSRCESQRSPVNKASDRERESEQPDPIKGQALAKQAIELAAAGGHSLLMIGPPGCGKTLLVKRLQSLLPRLSLAEAEELAVIRAVAGQATLVDSQLRRPLRSPHHSATAPALIGGGSNLCPGEISLAHHGVLFLDELPQFKPAALECLREPLETGEVHIARANYRASLPARFQLVAAMNPCPCGHSGNPKRQCKCSGNTVERYQARLSGPLLDRFDMVLELPALSQTELLMEPNQSWKPTAVRQRIEQCRSLQQHRQQGLNAHLELNQQERVCVLDSSSRDYLVQQMERLRLSSRAAHRLIKLARTVADLAQNNEIARSHLALALLMRQAALVTR